MVTRPDLRLLIAAMPTPMTDDEELALVRVGPLVEHYLQRGVEGLYCCGSSGEGLLLSADERQRLVREVIIAAAGRVPVIAHVGGLSTRESITLAEAAERDGASAVSMIPPIYYGYGLDEIIAHYRAAMDRTDLPMIIYNIPQFTGTEFTAASIAELLADPRVAGVKHTAHDLYALERMRAAYPDKTYLGGFDEVFLSTLAAGATGAIGTTIGLQPELFREVRSGFRDGDLERAQEAQRRINEVIATLVDNSVFPAAKYLTGRQLGVSLGPCRRPFRRLGADDRSRLNELADRIAEGRLPTVVGNP